MARALFAACLGLALAAGQPSEPLRNVADERIEVLRNLGRSQPTRGRGGRVMDTTSSGQRGLPRRFLNSAAGNLCKDGGLKFCDVELDLTPVLSMLPAGVPPKQMCGLVASSGMLPQMAMGMWTASCCVADCSSCGDLNVANELDICARDDPECDLVARGAKVTAHGPRSGSSITYGYDRPHAVVFEGASGTHWFEARSKEERFHPRYYGWYYPYAGNDGTETDAWARLASALDPENKSKFKPYYIDPSVDGYNETIKKLEDDAEAAAPGFKVYHAEGVATFPDKSRCKLTKHRMVVQTGKNLTLKGANSDEDSRSVISGDGGRHILFHVFGSLTLINMELREASTAVCVEAPNYDMTVLCAGCVIEITVSFLWFVLLVVIFLRLKPEKTKPKKDEPKKEEPKKEEPSKKKSDKKELSEEDKIKSARGKNAASRLVGDQLLVGRLEAVIFKKMLLTGALTVVAPGSTVQVVIGIIIVLFNLLYVLKTGPFADPADDFLAFSTSLQMIFTLLVAILLMTNKDTTQYDPNFADVVLVMVNSFSMLALMFSIIAMHPKIRKKLNNWKSEKKKVKTTKSTGSDVTTKIVPVSPSMKTGNAAKLAPHEDEVDDLRTWGKSSK
eukprot:g1651.t1